MSYERRWRVWQVQGWARTSWTGHRCSFATRFAGTGYEEDNKINGGSMIWSVKYGKIWLCLLDDARVPAYNRIRGSHLYLPSWCNCALVSRDQSRRRLTLYSRKRSRMGWWWNVETWSSPNAVWDDAAFFRHATGDVEISISLVGNRQDAKILWHCRVNA